MYKLFVFAVVASLAVESLAQECQPNGVPIPNVYVPIPSTAVPKYSEAVPKYTSKCTTTTQRQNTLSLDVKQCQIDCIVTQEYNPVCGSNDVTYSNPGRLLCAQMCGVKVTQVKEGRCSTN